MKISKRKFFLLASTYLLVSCQAQPSTALSQPMDISIVSTQTVEPVSVGLPTFQIREQVSSFQESLRLAQSIPASDFVPTGLYLPPQTELSLHVDQLTGKHEPLLLIGTYSRYAIREDPTIIQLNQGENIIPADEYGGLLYLQFVTEEKPTSEVVVTFKNGFIQAPYFILGETSNENWQAQLNNFPNTPDVLLESNYTIMVFSRENAQMWQMYDYESILRTADKIMLTEAYISGLDGSNEIDQLNVHKILMTETDLIDYYMFATHYRTAYDVDGAQYAFTPLLGSAEGWGPWHELGHMHQQDAWTWSAVTEVTVNIYSLAVQRALGYSPSRLILEDAWSGMDTFFSLPNRNYNDDTQANLFVRLCLFEQLRLAYGDEFYIELHKQTRREQPYLESDEERMQYFMVKASEISGENLTSFFRQWGFRNVEKAFDEIDALGLPKPIIEPSTLRE
jgi:hypothetical protein